MSTRTEVRRIARIQVRRSTYRGVEGWKIVGADARGRRVRIFSEHEPEVRRMAREIREGRDPEFDDEIKRRQDHPQSDAARRGWETRRARIEQTLSKVEELAARLRETADGLLAWQRNGQDRRPGAGKTGVHPVHAANRLYKLAEQLSSTKRRTHDR